MSGIITDLLELCSQSDVGPDTPLKVEALGSELAVFQVGDRYCVTQDLCTHGPGSLSEGYVDGEEVECPFHQGRFNILTGEAAGPPCTERLKIWTVTVRDGKICIDTKQHRVES